MSTWLKRMKMIDECFKEKVRENGESYYVFEPGDNETLEDFSLSVHGSEFWPSDFRFQIMAELSGEFYSWFEEYPDVEELDGLREYQHEFCDNLVDTHYSALTKWLASDTKRLNYCDQALDEGLWTSGDKYATPSGLIQAGQYLEIQEIAENFISQMEEAEWPEEEEGFTYG